MQLPKGHGGKVEDEARPDPPEEPSPPPKGGVTSLASNPAKLREATTTGLALIVAGVAAGLLLWSFGRAGAELRGDLTQQALTLLAAVLGYYFGRSPAERRAEMAEELASGALARERTALTRDARLSRVIRSAREIRRLVDSEGGDDRQAAEIKDQIRRELDHLEADI